ncbi:hypothetical protein Ocin01_12002 [Orchesella cincta]|uniref:Uncharacterized protein n=1 Tax=Orchesella cincta TaxID=48709 RepID=A0A1D2MP62_ORCCI|nr:hypothetical protein Ocin01_12002 [Orchesella cincta]
MELEWTRPPNRDSRRITGYKKELTFLLQLSLSQDPVVFNRPPDWHKFQKHSSLSAIISLLN